MSSIDDLDLSRQYFRAMSTNSVVTAYAAKIATLTKPVASATAGVLASPFPGLGRIPSNLKISPYSIGADNVTAKCRVLGWSSITESAVTLWVPTILCDFTYTASALVGIAASPVLNTERFADTITLNFGNQGTGVDVVSPADDLSPAHVLVDVLGHELIELMFHRNSSSTSNNALCAWL